MEGFIKNIIKYFLFTGLLFPNNSWKVYDDSELAIINITVDSDAISWMYDWDNIESDSLHIGTIHFQNAYIDESIDSIGFRLRGNTSRSSAKKSFKVDFNHFVSGRDFHGIEKLNLNGEHNDPSVVRAKLSWDLYQDMGMVSTRAAHAKLYINGEYYGLYISVEHIDDSFISKNFQNDNGNLWKCLWPADLTYRGDQAEDYYPYWDDRRPYELKTNTNEYDYSKLARLIRIIHQSPDSLDMVLDIKKTMQYLTMNILTGSWDDYRFLRNNFYLYHDPSDDLFHFIPYDYDNTFSIDWFDIDWSTIDPYDYSVIDSDGRPLTDLLFSEQKYRDLFSHFLEFYTEKIFIIDSISMGLDHWLDQLYQAAEEDNYRTMDYGFTIDDFVNSYGNNFQLDHVKQGLLEYITNRKTALDQQIMFEGNIPMIYESDKKPDIVIVGDTVNIEAAMFGSPLSFYLFYLKEGQEYWSSTSFSFQPDTLSYLIEDHDRWVANFIPDDVGQYYWYLFANSDDGSYRYPLYDFNSFEVIEPVANQPVAINELLAKNETVNSDEEGEFDDWIELFNYSDITVDLSYHFLTDKVDDLTKWQFPDSGAGLESGQYMLVWCDEDQEQGILHTNFKLSSSGEFIALVAPDGTTILDSVTFPPQTEDISYGISDLYDDEWAYMVPSPGSYNESLSYDDKTLPPGHFQLKNIYPNPFNSSFNIDLNMDRDPRDVTIKLFSLTGAEVTSKTIRGLNKGSHIISMEMKGLLSSGSYILRVNSEGHSLNRKVIYLK